MTNDERRESIRQAVAAGHDLETVGLATGLWLTNDEADMVEALLATSTKDDER